MDVVHSFVGDHKSSFLGPLEHVCLLDLVREEQFLGTNQSHQLEILLETDVVTDSEGANCDFRLDHLINYKTYLQLNLLNCGHIPHHVQVKCARRLLEAVQGPYYQRSPLSLVVEHPPCKREVASSILAGGYPFYPVAGADVPSILKINFHYF